MKPSGALCALRKLPRAGAGGNVVMARLVAESRNPAAFGLSRVPDPSGPIVASD